ncbi:MAG: transcription elongation factor Spt5 [Bdellovibrio sp.]|nr:MAG: transcription elongation factor Spt5 [Bdellovibrio sp.]
MVFYTARVATKQEKIVAMMLEQKAKVNDIPVFAILYNENVKGYIFIETDNENAAYSLVNGVKHVKGLLPKPLSFEDIAGMVKFEKPKKAEINIGDIVEIVSGPFKGETAKVVSLDKNKDEYTILPLEAVIAIPVRLKGKNLKLSKKAEESE